MLGDKTISPVGEEFNFRKISRRFLVAYKDIVKGEIITKDKVCVKRPEDGPGINPENLDIILGRVATNNVKEGKSLKWTDI